MSLDVNQVGVILSAALGGGLFTEIVRRAIPSKEKEMDVQLHREEQLAETEEKLRKALWDELERMTAKVNELEKKLTQATEIISALNHSNALLQLEITTLNKRLEEFTKQVN